MKLRTFIETKSCPEKIRFHTGFEAKQAKRKFQEKHGWKLVPYECSECLGWHLTSMRVNGHRIPIIGYEGREQAC